MKILFLSAVLPYPLYSGGQVRIYNLLRRLSKFHEIHLYSFIREHTEEKWLKELSFCTSVNLVYRGRAWQPTYVLSALTGKYPLLLSTYDNQIMKKRLTQALATQKFDLIHIEPGYVWPSVPESTLPIVVGEHNVEHRIYEEYVHSAPLPFLRPMMRRDVNKLEQWEQKIWQKASQVVAVSENDAKEIESYSGHKVSVVPNGVNEEQFQFIPKKEISDNIRCLFVGDFRWLQNRDAVKFLLTDVWPKVAAAHANAQLTIVGRDFPKALNSFITDSVSVREHVIDIVKVFHETDILLAPIRIGGGTKYKILEAMAAGVPIITTIKGVDGLVPELKNAVIIASSPEEWENGVKRFITDTSFRLSLVKAGRKGIEKNYTWSTISEKLNTVWKKAYEQKH